MPAVPFVDAALLFVGVFMAMGSAVCLADGHGWLALILAANSYMAFVIAMTPISSEGR